MGLPLPQDKVYALLIALAPILLAAFGPLRVRRPAVFLVPVFVVGATLLYAWRNREALAGEADLRRRLAAQGTPVEAVLLERTVGEQGEVRWAHFGYEYRDPAGTRRFSEALERVAEEDLKPSLDPAVPFVQAVGRLEKLAARCSPENPSVVRLECSLKTARWDRLVADADKSFLAIGGIGAIGTLIVWIWLIRRGRAPAGKAPGAS